MSVNIVHEKYDRKANIFSLCFSTASFSKSRSCCYDQTLRCQVCRCRWTRQYISNGWRCSSSMQSKDHTRRSLTAELIILQEYFNSDCVYPKRVFCSDPWCFVLKHLHCKLCLVGKIYKRCKLLWLSFEKYPINLCNYSLTSFQFFPFILVCILLDEASNLMLTFDPSFYWPPRHWKIASLRVSLCVRCEGICP